MGISPKLKHYRKHQGEWNAVFIGSSRIYRQVSPGTFDHLLQQEGYDVRSFNLGMDGMTLLETSFLLDHIIANQRSTPRWWFIEIGGITSELDHRLGGTSRTAYWHDAKRVHALWGEMEGGRRSSSPGPSKFTPLRAQLRHYGGVLKRWRAEFLPHLRLGIQHYSNMGTFSERLAHLGHWNSGVTANGYRPVQRNISTAQATVLRHDVEVSRGEKIRLGIITATTTHLLQDMVATVERSGATPIFIATPLPHKYPVYFATETKQPVVFYYDDPEKFPDLYAAIHRSDDHHLNEQGAELFTRALARDFMSFLKERGQEARRDETPSGESSR